MQEVLSLWTPYPKASHSLLCPHSTTPQQNNPGVPRYSSLISPAPYAASETRTHIEHVQQLVLLLLIPVVSLLSDHTGLQLPNFSSGEGELFLQLLPLHLFTTEENSLAPPNYQFPAHLLPTLAQLPFSWLLHRIYMQLATVPQRKTEFPSLCQVQAPNCRLFFSKKVIFSTATFSAFKTAATDFD